LVVKTIKRTSKPAPAAEFKVSRYIGRLLFFATASLFLFFCLTLPVSLLTSRDPYQHFDNLSEYWQKREGVFVSNPHFTYAGGLVLTSYSRLSANFGGQAEKVDAVELVFSKYHQSQFHLWLGFDDQRALDFYFSDSATSPSSVNLFANWKRTPVDQGRAADWKLLDEQPHKLRCTINGAKLLECSFDDGPPLQIANYRLPLSPLSFRNEDGVIVVESIVFESGDKREELNFRLPEDQVTQVIGQDALLALVIAVLAALLALGICRYGNVANYRLPEAFRDTALSSIFLLPCLLGIILILTNPLLQEFFIPIMIGLAVVSAFSFMFRIRSRLTEANRERPLPPLKTILRRRKKFWAILSLIMMIIFIAGFSKRTSNSLPKSLELQGYAPSKEADLTLGGELRLSPNIYSNQLSATGTANLEDYPSFELLLFQVRLEEETMVVAEFPLIKDKNFERNCSLRLPSHPSSYATFSCGMPWRGVNLPMGFRPIEDLILEPGRYYNVAIMFTEKEIGAYIDGKLMALLHVQGYPGNLVQFRTEPGRASIRYGYRENPQISFAEEREDARSGRGGFFLLLLLSFLFPIALRRIAIYARVSPKTVSVVFYLSVATALLHFLQALSPAEGFITENYNSGVLPVLVPGGVIIGLAFILTIGQTLWRRRVVAIIALVLCYFIINEVGARAQLVYDNQVDMRTPEWYWASWHTSPNRHRLDLKPLGAIQGELPLILGLGSSSTEGKGLINGELNYLSQLAKNGTPAGVDYETVNLAKYATVSIDGVYVLKAALAQIKPSVVLVSYLYNDTLLVPEWPLDEFDRNSGGPIDYVILREPFRDRILGDTQQVHFAFNSEKAEKRFSKTMAEIANLTEEAGAVPIFCIEPLANLEQQRKDIFSQNADALRKLAYSGKVRLIDFSDALQENGEVIYFFDQVHPTALGHQRIAQRIGEALDYWGAPNFETGGESYIYPPAVSSVIEEQPH
jgi:lysophospholipase L1-like esterase